MQTIPHQEVPSMSMPARQVGNLLEIHPSLPVDRSANPAQEVQAGPPPGAPAWVAQLSQSLNKSIFQLNSVLAGATGSVQPPSPEVRLLAINNVLDGMRRDILDLRWPLTHLPYQDVGSTRWLTGAFSLTPGGAMPLGYQGRVTFFSDPVTGTETTAPSGIITNFALEFWAAHSDGPFASTVSSSSSSAINEPLRPA